MSELIFSKVFVLGLAKYPIVFFVAFATTLFLTPIVRRCAIFAGVVDKPSPGRINKKEIPRAGGIAVVIGFFSSIVFALFFVNYFNMAVKIDGQWWLTYFLGAFFILMIGLVDDIWDMKPVIKLLCQICVAMIMYFSGVKFSGVMGVQIPAALEFVLTIGWFLGIINAFNLIDGLDGLATGLATIGAMGISGALIFMGLPGDALILVGFIGACLAFLRYNFHPASIFLGDSGSMFLGFTLGAVGLAVGTKGATVAALGIPLLAAGVPLFDTILAIWRRSVRRLLLSLSGPGPKGVVSKAGVMHRDLDHLHHRLLRGGLNQKKVAVLLYAANATLVITGLSSMIFASASAGIYLICFIVGSYVVTKHVANIELWDSGHAIIKGLRMPSTRLLLHILAPITDCMFLGLTLLAAMFFTAHGADLATLKSLWRSWAPVLCGVPFAVMAIGGIYSTIWTRARISEFFTLAVRLLAGGFFAWGVLLLIGYSSLSRSDTVTVALYLLLSLCFMLGSRALPALVEDMMSLSLRINLKGKDFRNILIFGSNDLAVLFLVHHSNSLMHNPFAWRERVIGILERDRTLKNRYIRGFPVFGGIDQIEYICSSTVLSEVILTEQLNPEEESFMRAMSIKYDFALTTWVLKRHVVSNNSGTQVLSDLNYEDFTLPRSVVNQ